MNRFVQLLALLVLALFAHAAADPRECEVCIEVLDLLDKKLSPAERTVPDKIEQRLGEICSDKLISETKKKVCYYLDPIKREVSRIYYLPKDKICKRLAQKSSEICAVRNKVKINKGSTDYGALKVKDLKKILADRGVMCDGCVEKQDFVTRCQNTEELEREL